WACARWRPPVPWCSTAMSAPARPRRPLKILLAVGELGCRGPVLWARLYCGVAGLREMSEYQLAATELGLLHRRAERGLVDNVSFGWRRGRPLAGPQNCTAGLLAPAAPPRHRRRPAWQPCGAPH